MTRAYEYRGTGNVRIPCKVFPTKTLQAWHSVLLLVFERSLICPFIAANMNRSTSVQYIWLNQLSNTTNLWWIYVYYIGINYMFRRLWPSSG